MKAVRSIVITLLSLMPGCRQAGELPTLPGPGLEPADCARSGVVVHTVSMVSGVVGYHRDSTRLSLAYHVPGTIDSQWTGVVCNLPGAYRVVGKRVTFSGEFRDAKGAFLPVFGGEELFYLYLTDIQSR